MHTNNVTSLTALTSQYGVSDSLKAMFEGLRETPGLSGDKFRHQDVNKFAQYIVCRNYGKLCLELSYLLYGIVNYQSSASIQPFIQLSKANQTLNPTHKLLDFFWLNENFSPARIRQYFTLPYHNSDVDISLSKTSLNIQFNKNTFSISPTRAGVLAVLFEFLMMIKPALIEQIELLFSVQGKGEREIKALSSALQKLLYEFLAEHLTNAQTQRRFRFITQWLNAQWLNTQCQTTQSLNNKNKQAYDDQFLTDENILSFWQMASTSDTSLSFKLYSLVLTDLIHVDQALKQTKQMTEVEQSLTLGDSNQEGELSADVLYQQLFEQCETEVNYDFLIQNPKFLTKMQFQTIKPFIDFEHYHKKLALSFARQAIFGQWQASIIQAKRQSQQQSQEKLNAVPDYNYLHYQIELAQLTNSIDDVLMAIIYLYLQLKVSDGISGLLLKLSPQDLAEVKQKLQQVLLLIKPSNVDNPLGEQRLFTAFKEVLAQSKAMQQIEQNLKKAFQKNNKIGFKALPNKSDLDIYRDGQAALQHCQKILRKQNQVFTHMWKNDECCLENFRSDTFIFKQSFENIYGIGVANDS